MNKRYVVIVKEEKVYNIVKCEELGLIMKVKKDKATLDFIEHEISEYLANKILKGETIPEGITKLRVPKALKNETIFIVSIDLELAVAKIKNRLVKKTLTIPEYLNVLGMRENLNFSQILAEALREKLNVK